MKKVTQFLRITSFVFFLVFGLGAFAQIGIGTITPAAGSIFDVTSTDKGVLVPRIDIPNLAAIAPVTGGATDGLLVWNIRVATGVGYHYWSVSAGRWIPLLTGVTPNANWALAGNTIAAANFLGTINALDLNIRTTNANRMRVQANGQVTVGWGAGPANTGHQFSALAVGTGIGVAGYSGGTGNGVYGQNNGGGNAVYGINNSTGNAISGWSLGAAATGDAIHAEHDGSGNAVDAVNYGTGVGVYGENFFFTNPSIHAVDGSEAIHAEHNYGGSAILAQARNLVTPGTSGDAIVVDADDPVSNSIWARNANALGTTILGATNGLSVFPGVSGAGIAGSGPKLGVFGYAGAGGNAVANRGNAAGQFTLDSDSDPSTNAANTGTRASATIAGFNNISPNGVAAAQNSYFGGYFSGGNVSTTAGNVPSFAYAGIKYNADLNGRGGTNYKIIGNGTNSTIIRDKTNTPRILFSPEAPEILFEDYGIGKLVNGVAQISIDPILKDAIYVDEKHPLKVFIQLEGDCNGVFVTNKSADGFTVKELASGTSNVSFSYHIVANRADDIDANGEISSKHVGLRFPVGPGPLKEQELTMRKESENKVGINPDLKSRSKRNVNSLTDMEEIEATKEEIEKISKQLNVSDSGSKK